MGDLTKDFDSKEFECPCGCGKKDIDRGLVHMLQSIRNVVDFPFIVDSGVRCEEHNKAVGGEDNSAHTRGKAADIKIPDSSARFRFLKEAMAAFKRVGIGGTFIHVDVDETLPQRVVWVYGKKE